MDKGEGRARGVVWGGGDVPHTVQRMNSILASFSRVRFRLIAMAASATVMVPMWCMEEMWLTLTR